MSGKNFIDLKDKVAIITGSSAGIGEAIALEFARQGCHLTLCGRDETRLEKVKGRCLEEAKGQIKIEKVVGDIIEKDIQRRIVLQTVLAFGKIDILVNNAGVILKRSPSNATLEDYNFIMRGNMETVFFLTQLAIPYLVKTKGNIVNISSIFGAQAAPEFVVYAMSKAAMDSYTKSLSLHLAPFQVRVNSVNPGSVVSLIYRRGNEGLDDEQYEKFKTRSSTLHPLGRMVLASECADAVAYLASERASFITGQILFVDGGRINLNVATSVGVKPKL